jgi:hypothetical protein
MDAHRLAEERSVAYHALVGQRILGDEAVLARARARIEAWAENSSVHPRWVEGWRQWLSLPPVELNRRLTERSEEANALRQVTPFAGVVEPRTRWRLWREVRERMSVR